MVSQLTMHLPLCVVCLDELSYATVTLHLVGLILGLALDSTAYTNHLLLLTLLSALHRLCIKETESESQHAHNRWP